MTTLKTDLAQPYQVDRKGALADKLAHFFTVSNGKVVDVVTGAVLPVAAGVTIVGDSMVFDGSSDAYVYYSLPVAIENPSFYGRVKYNVGDVDHGLFSINSTTTYSLLTAWADTSGGTLRTRIWASVGDFGSSGALTLGDWHNWGGSANATSDLASTWHNGVKTVVDSPIGSRDWEIGTDLYIGSRGVISNTNGEMEYLALFNTELTDQEFIELNADPYAMFQLPNTHEVRYQLKWSDSAGNQGLYVTGLDPSMPVKVSITLSEDMPYIATDGNVYLFDGRATNLDDATSDGSASYFWLKDPVGPDITDVRINDVVVTDFTPSTGEVSSAVAGDVISFYANIIQGSVYIGSRYSNVVPIAELALANVTIQTATKYHNFDLNRSKGETITDNGAVAKLINFSLDSGYTRGEDGNIAYFETVDSVYADVDAKNWKPLKARYVAYIVARDDMSSPFINPHPYNQTRGYYITKHNVRMTVTSNGYTAVYFNFPTPLTEGETYKITIEAEYDTNIFRAFLDDVQLGSDYHSEYVGERQRLDIIRLWGYTHIDAPKGIYNTKRVVLEDMEGVLPTIDLDMTTGDNNIFPDSVSDNHAKIHFKSTEKWQPVTPVDVFTIGSNIFHDYNGFNSFQLARKTSSNRQRALVTDTLGDTDQIFVYGDNFTGGLDLWGAKGLRWGIDTPKDTTTPCAELSQKINFYNSPLHLKGLRSFQQNTGYHKLLIEYYCNTAYSWDFKVGSNHVVRNSIVDGATVSLSNRGSTEMGSYTDCIILSRTVQKSGILRFYNCLFTSGSGWLAQDSYAGNGTETYANNCFFRYTEDQVTQTNCFSNMPLDTYYDAASGSYDINDVGQTALAGKGFNGTDIASWAYAEEVTVVGGTYTYIQETSYDLLESNISRVQVLYDLAKALSTSIETVYGLTEETTTTVATGFDLYSATINESSALYDLAKASQSTQVTQYALYSQTTGYIDTTYDLGSGVISKREALYTLTHARLSDIAASFGLYEQTTVTSEAVYALYEETVVTQSAAYALYEALTADIATYFALYGGRTTYQSSSYALYLSGTANIVANYALYEATYSASSASYSLYNKRINSNTTYYDLESTATTTTAVISAKYDLYKGTSYAVSTAYDLLKSAQETTEAAYDLMEQTTSETATAYDLMNAKTSANATAFTLSNATVAQVAALFSMYNEFVKVQTTRYNLYKDSEGFHSTYFDVYSSVTFTQTTYFDLGATVIRAIAKRIVSTQNKRPAYSVGNTRVVSLIQ